MKEIKDTDRIKQYLSQYGLEHVLPEGLRQHLALYRFESDEALCLQGEEPQYIHFIVQGKVKVYTTSTEGKTLLINFTTPLGVIGEIECLRRKENLNTVTAVSPVETIGFHKRWLSQYEGEVSFLRFLLDMVTDKFYLKSISLSYNLLYPVEVRIASYLLSISTEDENGAFSGVSMTSLKDTANLIGTSYRHLNRVLQGFSQSGLVERSKKTLIVKDRKGLTDVAGRNIYENGERKL
ncbi:Crp/Fnr family transcriptional regulator [Paenibacillus planticolens]|uniref:Cyclic nucleotide-binding domain-containing protein n=1 Tax=Paenibacillus planticolens TaxID=2654976 RepID=A0ABX1ZXR0_9BACL|nr:cyclic nucleotide-binding domain-containing protein [Paenibacillus planticolens]NOV04831.1 cyclic nucleotide-binding domain-containing protein [Paenibacillus planticolens]